MRAASCELQTANCKTRNVLSTHVIELVKNDSTEIENIFFFRSFCTCAIFNKMVIDLEAWYQCVIKRERRNKISPFKHPFQLSTAESWVFASPKKSTGESTQTRIYIICIRLLQVPLLKILVFVRPVGSVPGMRRNIDVPSSSSSTATFLNFHFGCRVRGLI